MQIEKVSKYINVTVGGTSLCDASATRKVLMSLPRVKWLERDEEYIPPPEIKVEVKAFPIYAQRPVSPREEEAYQLKLSGKELSQIADIMRVSETAAASYVATAKRKKQYLGEHVV
jgi:DNA-binding NarL/FixJ family response regulator